MRRAGRGGGTSPRVPHPPRDGDNESAGGLVERSSSISSVVSTSTNATNRTRPRQGGRLRQAAARVRGGRGGGLAEVAARAHAEVKREREVAKQDEETEVDRRRRWDAEMEKVKQQAIRLAQLERLNSDLQGRIQSMQLKHEAEMSDVRQEIIGFVSRIDDLKETLRVKESIIADQAKQIHALRTGMNMSRVQLAYNFVAQYSNIDVVVQPEEIFSNLVSEEESSPQGILRRQRRRLSAPFASPAKGKVQITVLKPPRPGEWRQQKFRLRQTLAKLCRCEQEELKVSEHDVPDVFCQDDDSEWVMLQIMTRTGKEAEDCAADLRQRKAEDGMIEGVPVRDIVCSGPEGRADTLTPAGLELLRFNTELADAQSTTKKQIKRETNWERERREQLERDKAFEVSRVTASRRYRESDIPPDVINQITVDPPRIEPAHSLPLLTSFSSS